MTPRTLECLIDTHTEVVSGKPVQRAHEQPVETFTADDIAELEQIKIY